MQGKIIAKKYNKENVKADSNYKISKKLPDCFDQSFYYLCNNLFIKRKYKYDFIFCYNIKKYKVI